MSGVRKFPKLRDIIYGWSVTLIKTQVSGQLRGAVVAERSRALLYGMGGLLFESRHGRLFSFIASAHGLPTCYGMKIQCKSEKKDGVMDFPNGRKDECGTQGLFKYCILCKNVSLLFCQFVIGMNT